MTFSFPPHASARGLLRRRDGKRQGGNGLAFSLVACIPGRELNRRRFSLERSKRLLLEGLARRRRRVVNWCLVTASVASVDTPSMTAFRAQTAAACGPFGTAAAARISERSKKIPPNGLRPTRVCRPPTMR